MAVNAIYVLKDSYKVTLNSRAGILYSCLMYQEFEIENLRYSSGVCMIYSLESYYTLTALYNLPYTFLTP